jgi:RimJ/RimL family protein N-acetyltransferase
MSQGPDDPSLEPTLLTSRLLMRRWQPADRDPFAALSADPEVMRYFQAPLTRAESDAMIDRIEVGMERAGFGLWALQVRESGEFIGFTGLSVPTFTAPFLPGVEIGWRLARAAWGHGYATEAARAALDFGFNEIGLTQVISFTTVTNAASRAVMTRLGMTRDPAEDFDHPRLPESHPLRPHVLYRLTSEAFS